jgi:hypothetical protein
MSHYTSQITFLYYQDLSYGEYVMKTVLDLQVIMDQGFAQIYQVGKDSFLGIVSTTDPNHHPGHSLVSLNTLALQDEYERIQQYDVKYLTKILYHKDIPLHSFFFQDQEGHRFEIQMFERVEDQTKF